MKKQSISIILPIYNEENSIEKGLAQIKKALDTSGWTYEIIAVNDCSKDRSVEILKNKKDVKVISNPYNLGYGASIKRGMHEAQHEWIGITDLDGTYPNEDFEKLLTYAPHYDMVVGARTGKTVKVPLSRRPAKWLLGKLANFMSQKKIPDINSGLRIFKKARALEFLHLYPQRFSFTTTITLSFLTSGYPVKYIPINYFKRKGSSGIKAKDFFGFISIICRVVMYFKPLRFFFWPAILLLLAGIVYGVVQVMISPDKGLGQLPIILIVSSVQILFLGLLADLIVRSRGR